jgi:hypothetical protein
MAGVFDATFVKHRVDEVFKVNRGVADSIHKRFEHHHERATEWRQHGPIFVHHTPEGPTLVKFEVELESNLDRASQEKIVEDRLNEVRAVLESLKKPDEEYHLTLEERPIVGDVPTGRTLFYIKGVIVGKGA